MVVAPDRPIGVGDGARRPAGSRAGDGLATGARSADGHGSHGEASGSADGNGHRCRFELAAPRHFLYPALLLLLTEEPRHGYRLVDSLLRLGFGPVDRPAVYRALADLEADGYLESWEMAPPGGGSTRNVYGVTEGGADALRRWMAVIAEESHCLTRVLSRFTLLSVADHGPAGDG